jgi:hypothetical protein
MGVIFPYFWFSDVFLLNTKRFFLSFQQIFTVGSAVRLTGWPDETDTSVRVRMRMNSNNHVMYRYFSRVWCKKCVCFICFEHFVRIIFSVKEKVSKGCVYRTLADNSKNFEKKKSISIAVINNTDAQHTKRSIVECIGKV